MIRAAVVVVALLASAGSAPGVVARRAYDDPDSWVVRDCGYKYDWYHDEWRYRCDNEERHDGPHWFLVLRDPTTERTRKVEVPRRVYRKCTVGMTCTKHGPVQSTTTGTT